MGNANVADVRRRGMLGGLWDGHSWHSADQRESGCGMSTTLRRGHEQCKLFLGCWMGLGTKLAKTSYQIRQTELVVKRLR